MRLLHTKKLELEEFGGNKAPRYAILSHTWGEEEVTLQDIKTNKSVVTKKLQRPALLLHRKDSSIFGLIRVALTRQAVQSCPK
jgi:hypothetical protein